MLLTQIFTKMKQSACSTGTTNLSKRSASSINELVYFVHIKMFLRAIAHINHLLAVVPALWVFSLEIHVHVVESNSLYHKC